MRLSALRGARRSALRMGWCVSRWVWKRWTTSSLTSSRDFPPYKLARAVCLNLNAIGKPLQITIFRIDDLDGDALRQVIGVQLVDGFLDRLEIGRDRFDQQEPF